MASHVKAIVEQLLVPSLLIFFLVGGLFGIAVGIGLIVNSGRTLQFFNFMNRWISLRRHFKAIAIPRDMWPFVRQHRYWFALLIVAGAMFAAVNLIVRVDLRAATDAIGATMHRTPRQFIGWIVESVWWLLLLGSILGMVVGAMLGFSPAALAALEKTSSRWISMRGVIKGGDAMHWSLDHWVAAHPHRVGWVVLVIASIEVFDVGVLLF